MLKRRVVLITGKGGVGRSCVTAALAQVATRRSLRVLIADIGDEGSDYSPLARHFGKERLPEKPEEMAPGVKGVTLLARTGQEQFLAEALHTATLARAALHSDAIRKLLAAGPSFREMGVFFQLLTYLRAKLDDGSDEYQLIVLDMPATGHTLSLTGLPELLLRLVPRGPIAEALKEGQSYLNDPAKGAAYVVTLPETLPVSECLELLDGLSRTRMPSGGVILNRIPGDPFTPAERAALAPLVDRYQVFGADGFRKVELAQREVGRLRKGTQLPILSIPDFAAAGDQLIAQMADALDRGAPLPRSFSHA